MFDKYTMNHRPTKFSSECIHSTSSTILLSPFAIPDKASGMERHKVVMDPKC